MTPFDLFLYVLAALLALGVGGMVLVMIVVALFVGLRFAREYAVDFVDRHRRG